MQFLGIFHLNSELTHSNIHSVVEQCTYALPLSISCPPSPPFISLFLLFPLPLKSPSLSFPLSLPPFFLSPFSPISPPLLPFISLFLLSLPSLSSSSLFLLSLPSLSLFLSLSLSLSLSLFLFSPLLSLSSWLEMIN